MSSVRFMDGQGPPRKKMRKGTKSCTECRRRKIRCTYDENRPNICNECHSRGFTCIDQEYGTLEPKVNGPLSGEQSYSLRERVTQLENVVKDILDRMERTSPSTSPSPLQNKETKPECFPTSDLDQQTREVPIRNSKLVDAPITDANEMENAPVLQILNNNVVSRTQGNAIRNQDAGATKDFSAKAIAARNELVKLIPPRGDLIRIRNLVSHWWSAFVHIFPEVLDKCKASLLGEDDLFELPESPGEVAKFIICHLMSIEQMPADFNYSSLEMPIDVPEYTERCVSTIDRLVINDEDLSSTLPGLESMALLGKWYWNLGRPRKSWLTNRKAIELGQLAGLHISTSKDPHPNDTLYERRLKLWTVLGLNDRFLCLILGLPPAFPERFFRPQVERRLKMENNHMETYCLRMCLVVGPMVDRNQDDPADMSIAETLRLEQELEEQARHMPKHFWEPGTASGLSMLEAMEGLMLPFIYHFTRATLHMPFMLRSQGDQRYRYSHEAAVESARNALMAYNKLRSWDMMNPFICRMIDFQAFSMSMLVIINILGYSEHVPNHTPEQDERDWALVDATADVLRHAAAEPAGTVAAQSLVIIDGLSQNINQIDPNVSCKISVPYFGVITMSPGKKALAIKQRPKRPTDRPTPSSGCSFSSNNNNNNNNNQNPSSGQPSPYQLYTPPQSNTGESNGGMSSYSDQASSSSHANYTPPLLDDSRVQLENIFTLPNAGMMDQNVAFTGFTAGNDNMGLWTNMNLDLDLDQGWNLDWSNGTLL